MDLLNESERRFTKKLCDAMIPVMITAFWEIWLEAKKEVQDKKSKNVTLVFQELLRAIKTWNSSISLKNTEAIVKAQPLFPNLLAAVFVIHVKILSAIRTDKKSKKICIKLPQNDVFVQRCYEACAKDLYEDPYVITEFHSEVERNENLTKRFTKHIMQVIEDLVPTAEILQTYLPLPAAGEDLNLDHEDEDPEADDEVPDMMNEDPVPANDGEPAPEPNMEFGKTPGGVDNTVTVNNSMTPPNVPGTTPAGPENVQKMEQNLFDDAAESKTYPQRIEKLG
jgi:Family of unknown function (DUF5764)